jgi:hypothetical protein
MISVEEAKKRIAELEYEERTSAQLRSTLDIQNPSVNCGGRNKPKPTLDDMDRWQS